MTGPIEVGASSVLRTHAARKTFLVVRGGRSPRRWPGAVRTERAGPSTPTFAVRRGVGRAVPSRKWNVQAPSRGFSATSARWGGCDDDRGARRAADSRSARCSLQAAGDLAVREQRRTRCERRRPRTGDRREPNDLRGGRGAVAASILPLRPPLPPYGATHRHINRSNGGIGKWGVSAFAAGPLTTRTTGSS
uniref:OrfD n=1 Tax=Halorubrum saccharovorum TaxID=2248 RepID=Q8J2Z9_9EURY|nr:orfD [Halorubrum saccharovorum]